jgi:hypothetical protein
MVRLLASAWRLRALALGAALSLAFAVFGAASVGAGAAQPGTLFPGSSEPQSVFCTSGANCWAVGLYAAKTGALVNEITRHLGDNSLGGSQIGEALHWKGTKWTLAATPNPAGTTNEARNVLNSVRCLSAKDCWIVGFSQANDDPDASLFLHWNSTKWSVGP